MEQCKIYIWASNILGLDLELDENNQCQFQ